MIQPLPKNVILDHNTNLPFCTLHNCVLVFKEPGVSKRTGKPYSGFYACPHKDNLGFCSSTVKPWQVDKLPAF
jgi:hypothetical protein